MGSACIVNARTTSARNWHGRTLKPRGASATLTCGYNKNGSHRSAKDLENGTATGYTYDMDTTGWWERSGETAAGSPTASTRRSERVNCPAVGSRTQEAPTGTLVESYNYDAFGTPCIFDASGSALSASPRENRFLFTGREWFAEIATYDYRNRIYNATLGRLLQTDPIRYEAGDVNLYRYVANGPVDWVDPWGHETAAVSIHMTFKGKAAASGRIYSTTTHLTRTAHVHYSCDTSKGDLIINGVSWADGEASSVGFNFSIVFVNFDFGTNLSYKIVATRPSKPCCVEQDIRVTSSSNAGVSFGFSHGLFSVDSLGVFGQRKFSGDVTIKCGKS